MIFRSNITAPDLYPAFAPRVVCKPRHNSFGHDVLSDPEREPECGFLTHDEAAILYNVAMAFPGEWLDIGGAAGWSAAHMLAAGRKVLSLDPLWEVPSHLDSAKRNLERWSESWISRPWHSEYFYCVQRDNVAGFDSLSGALIDGDHSSPHPKDDVYGVSTMLHERGVIVLHDVLGGSIQDAVVWLMDNGFKSRIYWTPHVMAVCWRGDFTPPDHVGDPNVERCLRPQMASFPFERCV